MHDKRKRIQKRAYEIWEAEGRADGHDEDHWRRAELEIEADERRRGKLMAKSDPPSRRQREVNSRRRVHQ
ncbi:MAG: DUF2934 domain-containing protein [Devosia sp.]|uniref:DUF2934 domain-containing protein n=1 Tax=Devosia sp. TaxID=1871048 RepID=UPI001ACF02F9|nr:DUF2934 domain-containing protein [Devosia sp.]MBN9308788.1 DUF2934 domain-containing protein [Devosia sp.]MBN9317274.1 DUF2934 domain-containing protein [Devosia sp.]